MKKRLLIKNKLRSKKGMSLVEVLVGVAIIVIVFASTLSGMVNGYTTTVYNADGNREDLLDASVNEIIFGTFRCLKIEDESQAKDLIDNIKDIQAHGISPSSDESAVAVVSAINERLSGVVFVPPTVNGSGNYEAAFVDGQSYQYTLIPETTSLVTSGTGGTANHDISGMRIMTRFETASGEIICESFVPYI